MYSNQKLSSLFVSVLAFGLVGCNTATTPAETDLDAVVPTEVVEDDGATIEKDMQASDEAAMGEVEYKDGTYEAVGEYTSPGGEEEVGVKITIEDGVIVDSEVEVLATREISVKMQNVVKDEHQELVVGMELATLELDKVGGSSLTPKGFNDALDKIREEAKV